MTDHNPLSGADMLLREQEDRRAASSGESADLKDKLQRTLEALQGSEEARLATERKLAETKRAASVAMAAVMMQSVRLRDFLAPERLAKEWYTAYRTACLKEISDPAMGMNTWDGLSHKSRQEILAIAADVQESFRLYDSYRAQELDPMADDMLQEGEQAADELHRLERLKEILREFWNLGVHTLVKKLHDSGIDFLPPGTIVHGVSTKPHKPE